MKRRLSRAQRPSVGARSEAEEHARCTGRRMSWFERPLQRYSRSGEGTFVNAPAITLSAGFFSVAPTRSAASDCVWKPLSSITTKVAVGARDPNRQRVERVRARL